jgi:hypothetical protein
MDWDKYLIIDDIEVINTKDHIGYEVFFKNGSPKFKRASIKIMLIREKIKNYSRSKVEIGLRDMDKKCCNIELEYGQITGFDYFGEFSNIRCYLIGRWIKKYGIEEKSYSNVKIVTIEYFTSQEPYLIFRLIISDYGKKIEIEDDWYEIIE